MRNPIAKILGSIALICTFFCFSTTARTSESEYNFKIGDEKISVDLSIIWKPASSDIPGAKRFVSPSGKMEAFLFALSDETDYDRAVKEIRRMQRERSLDDSYLEEMPVRESRVPGLFLRDVRFSRLRDDETPYFHGYVLGAGLELFRAFRPTVLIVAVSEGRKFVDGVDVFSYLECSFCGNEEKYPVSPFCACAFEKKMKFEIGNTGVVFSAPAGWKLASGDLPNSGKVVSPSGNIEIHYFALSDSADYVNAMLSINAIQKRLAPDKPVYSVSMPIYTRAIDGLYIRGKWFHGPSREEDPFFFGAVFSELPDEKCPVALIVCVTDFERCFDHSWILDDIKRSFHREGRRFFRKETGNI